ncbi:BTAD domain-containing putative transcriptional regulator [Nonomuraea sp. NPDC048826]|uniref:AfsR/SARP family transcriptional regulator n=1 Tax=Nonomuraea sp. NPDC048826 TaxID=3364347 RepID=UPI0037239377
MSDGTNQISIRKFGVLGPLRIWVDDQEHTPTRQNVGRLLGVLLLTPGRLVGREALIDLVWGETGCDQQTLYSTVSRLRTWLHRHIGITDAVARMGSGYRIDVPAESVDAGQFRRLYKTAQRETDPRRRIDLFVSALKLWRGPVLADLLEPHACPAVGELDKLRVDCACRLAEDALHYGNPVDAIEPLSSLASSRPFDEVVNAHLITLLGRSGRRAEGLRRFERLRVRLSEELGVEPSPPLLAARMDVLRVTRPMFSAQNGSRLCLLPPDLADFTGRDRQLDQIGDRLTGRTSPTSLPMVMISGMPGVGKTSLAAHAAHLLAERFPDGQLYVDLHGAGAHPAQPEDVLARLLRVLGVHPESLPESLDERTAVFRALLSGKRILLILDNARDVEQIRPLLPGHLDSGVIVTSRSRLAKPYGMHHLVLDVMDRQEAVDLLTVIMGESAVVADHAAVGKLAEVCGYLPLALRVAGERMVLRPHQRVAQLVGALENRENTLDEFMVGTLDVRASLMLSYAGLPSGAARLFRLLGLLDTADFGVWAAAALLGTSLPEVEQALERLVEHSLLSTTRAKGAADVRYRFHDLVRAFARERLQAEEPDEARRLALDRFFVSLLDLLGQAHCTLWDQEAVVTANRAVPPAARSDWGPAISDSRWLESELSFIVEATQQASRLGMHRVCWQLAVTGMFLFEALQAYDEWWETHQVALVAARAADDLLGAALVNAGLAFLCANRYLCDEAEHYLRSVMPVAERAGDEQLLGRVLTLSGWVNHTRGRFAAAHADYRRAIDVLQGIGSQGALALALRLAGSVCLDLGKIEAAETFVNRAIALADAHGHVSWLRALVTFAEVQVAKGEAAPARPLFSLVLQAAKELDSPHLQFWALYGLGSVHLGQREYLRAAEHFKAAVPYARLVREHHHHLRFLLAFAENQRRLGALEEAGAHLREAVAISRRLRSRPWEDRAVDALRELSSTDA